MALTKISGSILKDPLNLGEVSIGGTLTYQDVTNVDALGIGTFRAGVKVLAGGINAVGVVTATSFVGSGANLTSLPSQLTLSNNADNRIITGGSGTNLNGEANLTWDGSAMAVGHSNPVDTLHVYHATDNIVARFESGDTGGGITLKDSNCITSLLNTNGAFEINVDQGGDITGETILFKMSGSEKLRIASNGGIGIATDKIPRNYFLHIAAPSQDYTNTSTQLTDGGGIMFQHTDTLASTGRTYPGIFWSGNTSALGRARAGIIGVTASNNDATHIAFLTRIAANGTSFYPSDERMRIASNGVVAISTTTDSDAKSLNVYTPGSGDGKYAMQIENGYQSGGGGNVLKMKTGRGDGSIDIDVVRLDLYNNTRIFSIDNSGLMRFRSGCGSGSQDALAVYGVRAWINFRSDNGTIRGKGGLSGVTDLGVGQFRYNFSTSMPDGNYTVTCNSGNSGSGTSNRNRMSAYDLTTASFKIDDYDSGVGIGPSLTDRQMVHVMVVR